LYRDRPDRGAEAPFVIIGGPAVPVAAVLVMPQSITLTSG
jgi:hypothetical protein